MRIHSCIPFCYEPELEYLFRFSCIMLHKVESFLAKPQCEKFLVLGISYNHYMIDTENKIDMLLL